MAWTQDFMDTFLGYPIGSITSLGKWTSSVVAPSTATAEDGGQCISGPNYVSRTLTSSSRGRMFGLRGKTRMVDTGTTTVARIVDDANNLRFNISIIESSGAIRIDPPDSGSGTQAPVTSATAITSAQAWYTIEGGVFFDGVNAYWETRLNGTKVTDLSGSIGNTQTPTLNQIRLGSGAGSPGMIAYSHIWSKKATTSYGVFVDADWLGNVQRGILRPDAEGTNYPAGAGGARWTPVSGSTYYEMLDETLADDTTSYIQNVTSPTTPAAADRASWRFENSPANVQSVKMVQRQTLLRLSVGSAATFRMGFSTTGNTGDAGVVLDSSASTMPSSFLFHLTQYPQDPRGTPAAWTKAKLDTLDGVIQLDSLTP